MRVRFRDVTFDTGARRLSRDDRELHLSPKAFELLALLIERSPHAVSKPDIRDRLWPGTFVSETNLPALVTEVRRTIGDDARQPRLVRTLPRFGYAFQGELHNSESPVSGRPSGWLVGNSARVPLFTGENLLGREGPDVIVVDSATVSRHHARLVIDGRNASIADLGSKNGTYLNERRVTASTALVDGSRVRLGSLLFTFRVAHHAVSTQTEPQRDSAARPKR